MEPLLLCDGTPKWLQELLSSLSDSGTLSEKALIFSLVVLMYETGLHLENSPPSSTGTFDIKLMEQLPSIVTLVKDDGRYKLTFIMSNSMYSVHLVVTPMDSILIVNLLVPDVKVVSCALTISDFIDIHPPSRAAVKNNAKLSILFKNHVDSIIAHLFENSYGNRHLFSLPVEIMTYICEHLTPQDFVSFGKTCHRANVYLENDHIWKSLARLYLPSHKTAVAARIKINEEYKKNKQVDDVEKVKEMVGFSKAVEEELKTTVIQARETEPGKFTLRITPETTKLDNFPFDPNVEIPRAKRRELAKACCQVKID